MPISRDAPRLQDHEILAAREYFAGEARERRIVVRIGIPRRRPDGRFECVAELDEGEIVSSKPMNGVDAFEAIQLALMLIGDELTCIREYSNNSLTWLDGVRLDFGFPTFPDYSLREVMESA